MMVGSYFRRVTLVSTPGGIGRTEEVPQHNGDTALRVV
jgi:hypothetical protein